METGFMNRITGLVIALVVGGLLVGGLLIPSIEGMTATEKTIQNNGYARYNTIEDTATEELIITWDGANYNTLNVGDNEIDLSSFNVAASLVFGENWTMRYTQYSNGGLMQYLGPTTSDYFQVASSDNKTFTLTLDNGTVTATDGTNTKTTTYTKAYYVDNSGSMIMKKTNDTAYLLKDSSIVIANGLTAISGGTTLGIYFDGTIADSYTVNIYRTADEYAISNIQSNYTNNSTYKGVVELSTITFDITPEGGAANPATYSYFLVPYEITAELAQHMTPTEIAMFGVISILGIVALVVVAANGIRNKY